MKMINRYVSVYSDVVMQPLIPSVSDLRLKGFTQRGGLSLWQIEGAAMCNYESFFEPDEHGRIWRYGDRYSREDENDHEFYIRVGTNYLFHSEGGPAKRSEDSDGVHEEYWIHGIQHREDGPAVIHYEEEPFIFYKSMTKAERISEGEGVGSDVTQRDMW